MAMIRVRSIIDHLDYSALCATGLVPELWRGLTIPSKVPYPAFIHSERLYSEYGCFVEVILLKALAQRRAADLVLPYNIATGTTPESLIEKIFRVSKKGLKPTIARLETWVQTYLEPILPKGWMSSDFELRLGRIEGHPDLVIVQDDGLGLAIYDIKTIVSFERSRAQLTLQLLTYYAIARANGFNVTSVGAILPIQGQVLTMDMDVLRSWNTDQFLSLITS